MKLTPRRKALLFVTLATLVPLLLLAASYTETTGSLLPLKAINTFGWMVLAFVAGCLVKGITRFRRERRAPGRAQIFAGLPQIFTALVLFWLAGVGGVSVSAQFKDFTPRCSGTNDTTEFSGIVTQLGSNTGSIRLPWLGGSRCAVGNVTVPSNVALDFTNTTGIKVNTGATLTVRGDIIGPDAQQHFYNATAGLGTVSFSGNLSVSRFRPQWWGGPSVADGLTSALASINAAIAAWNSRGDGELYFSAGTYVTTGGLTPITANGSLRGDGRGDAHYLRTTPPNTTPGFGTKITSSSATNVLFTIKSNALMVEGIYVRNVSGTTPTAGSGFWVYNDKPAITYTDARGNVFTSAGGDFLQTVSFRDVMAWGFYDCWDMQIGDDWRMDNVYGVNGGRYGVRIRNTAVPDAGGWTITNSTFVSDAPTVSPSNIAIKVESCGGAKLTNTNILGYGRGIVVDNSGGPTSVLLITGNSFENLHGPAIDISNTSGGTNWQLITVSGCEFGYYETDAAAIAANAIKFSGVDRSSITGNTFWGSFNSSQVAILLNNCSGIRVTGNQVAGWTREVGYTGTYTASIQQGATYRQAPLSGTWAAIVGFQPPGYNYVDGKVKLVGAVSSGTADSTILVLPVGYRPSADHVFTVASNTGTCQVRVYSNGDVKQQGAGGSSGFTISGCSTASLWLDGIEFVPYQTTGP